MENVKEWVINSQRDNKKKIGISKGPDFSGLFLMSKY